jgi:hypothetical protein
VVADDEPDDEEEDGVDAFLDVTLPPASLLLSALSTSWATSFTEVETSSILHVDYHWIGPTV